MELEVYWLHFAEDKLIDIYNYYNLKAGLKVAVNLINGIIDTTINLEQNPEIGQLDPFLENNTKEFRFLVYKNYKIVYWINYEFQRIEIANVFDTRQNPEKILETE